jgi:hypothetical protein
MISAGTGRSWSCSAFTQWRTMDLCKHCALSVAEATGRVTRWQGQDWTDRQEGEKGRRQETCAGQGTDKGMPADVHMASALPLPPVSLLAHCG